MKTYIVEYQAHVFGEAEVKAESEEEAIAEAKEELAFDGYHFTDFTGEARQLTDE